MYQLRLTSRARRELDKIPAEEFDRLLVALKQLESDPRHLGAKKLRGNIYRVRQGGWRVVYAVFDQENEVIVGKIARRSEDTYDGVRDLF